jgi:hypothetical protein
MDAQQEEKLLSIIKDMKADIYKLKKENLIIKYILKSVLNVPDDIYNKFN